MVSDSSATQGFDARGDASHALLHRLAQQYDFPDYVKQASPTETLRPEGLPAGGYADVVAKEFPCHTKAACFVSHVYFLEHRESIPAARAEKIAQALQRAARRFGVEADLQAAQTVYEQHRKSAAEELPDSSFAIVWAGEDGRKDRRYPLRNGPEVKAASAWFAKFRDEFLFHDRCRIANKLLEKAAEHGVRLPDDEADMLEKQAGRGVCDPGEAARHLRARARQTHIDGSVRETLQKLASDLEAQPLLAEDLTTMRHLAATVDEVDRRFNLTYKYGSEFTRPEDFLFVGMFKYAADFVANGCALTTGSVYEKNQFAKLSVATIREHFGDEIAQAVSTGLRVDGEKMATVAPTLPLPDAVTLDRLMRSCGQPPVREKSANAELTPERRRALAAEYAMSQRVTSPTLGVAPSGVQGSQTIER